MVIRSLSVAVLGAGHGGLALAGYLSQRGHRVALWNRSPERVEAVAARGGIVLTSPGPVSAFARIDVQLATPRVWRMPAWCWWPCRLPVMPTSRRRAPYLRDGQTVLPGGRTGGALEFRADLNRAGCKARIVLGEANTFPFAARGVGPASAVIYGSKAEVLAAALPATRTPELIAVCKAALPMLAPAPSVMHTSLANVGAILHPIITLLNADRIARGVSFDFYSDGVNETVAETLAAADAERVADRPRVRVRPSLIEWVETAYGHRAEDVRGAIGGNPSYVGIKAPNTLQHRYLTEDVPTGLIPLIALGRAAGLELPTLTRIAERCQDILGGEPWQRPRTLEALGLAGLGKFGIRALVERGSAPVTRPSIRVAPFDGRSRPTVPVAVPTLIRSVSA